MIYLIVVDVDGMMVLLIQFNYCGMGSGMVLLGLGFILQDCGEMFVLQKDYFNGYVLGKCFFQIIILVFVIKDGKLWMSFGVMGGVMQLQGYVQIVMNMVDFGMNLQEVGDVLCIQYDGLIELIGQVMVMSDGGEVNLEMGFLYEIVCVLMCKGYWVVFVDGFYGGYQVILCDLEMGVYYGVLESCKDGQVVGY